MYRIHFDPRIGRFIIQVLVFGLFWSSVKKLAESNDKTESLTFHTFEGAVNHIQSIGLDKLYKDGSAMRYRAYMNQNQMYAVQGVHHG